eukprot:TRINITY_DN21171_c0_g1_i1.p1 TRINITY_DN21171_c0_g1~~TRINITY_DN21171_c0_g1_i1.p1  ORF type:complete len:165 (+),score=13.02 TRINITY_DN21171_c0_g1_i1:190-684(+)
MANKLLFRSAAFLGPLSCIAYHLCTCPTTLYLLSFFVVTTSVWNHGTTSRLAQLADRITLVLTCCASAVTANAVYETDPKAGFVAAALLSTAISCYIVEKILCTTAPHLANSLFHLGSHVFGTILNLFLAVTLSVHPSSCLEDPVYTLVGLPIALRNASVPALW